MLPFLVAFHSVILPPFAPMTPRNSRHFTHALNDDLMYLFVISSLLLFLLGLLYILLCAGCYIDCVFYFVLSALSPLVQV